MVAVAATIAVPTANAPVAFGGKHSISGQLLLRNACNSHCRGGISNRTVGDSNHLIEACLPPALLQEHVCCKCKAVMATGLYLRRTVDIVLRCTSRSAASTKKFILRV